MNALHKYAAKRLLVERLLQKLAAGPDLKVPPLKAMGAPETKLTAPTNKIPLPPPTPRTAEETARMGLLKKKKKSTAVVPPQTQEPSPNLVRGAGYHKRTPPSATGITPRSAFGAPLVTK